MIDRGWPGLSSYKTKRPVFQKRGMRAFSFYNVQTNVTNLTSLWFPCNDCEPGKPQVSFRAKRGIFAGADSYVTLEDFSRWSK